MRVYGRERLAAELTITRVYDVRDLLADGVRTQADLMARIPKGPPPDPALGVFGGASVQTSEERADAIASAVADELVAALDVATGHGGVAASGTIPARRYFGGRLIVNAPPAEHAQIAELLRNLRATKR